MLELRLKSKKSEFVVSDPTWVTSAKETAGWQNSGFDDSSWTRAVSQGKLGDKPWGDVLKVPKATSAESLTVSPGFKVELVRSSQIGEGSWICIAVDAKGRLIISPEAENLPLLRVSLSGLGQVSKVEKIPAPLHHAMGLLYAHDSLYVNGHGPNGTGLYRLIDSNHNVRFDTNEVPFLKNIGGGGANGLPTMVVWPGKINLVMNRN